MFLNTYWSLNQPLCSVPQGRNLSHLACQWALTLLNASNKIYTVAAIIQHMSEGKKMCLRKKNSNLRPSLLHVWTLKLPSAEHGLQRAALEWARKYTLWKMIGICSIPCLWLFFVFFIYCFFSYFVQTEENVLLFPAGLTFRGWLPLLEWG